MSYEVRSRANRLAQEHLARGDAQGWFEELYLRAGGDSANIPWADLQPSPLLIQLLDREFAGSDGECAVVGCGLGDDAEELARRGFRVTGFDLSATAISWCRERWPDTAVDYREADLLELPPDMAARYSLVVEINTLQAVPEALRMRMFAPLASLVAPGGSLLLICRMRDNGEEVKGPPWALCQAELDTLCADHGLENIRQELLTDGEDPPNRRFVAIFQRPPA